MSPLAILAAAVSALAVGLLFRAIAPPPRRLHARVDPYVSPTLSTLTASRDSGPIQSVFGPMIRDIANWVGRALDRSGSGVTLLRLRQADWFNGLTESEMITSYRMTQLRALVAGLVTAALLGQVLGASPALRLVLIGLGTLFGATRTRGRLDKAIETRRDTMKVEIYTVNQLLAMRVRAGGGVIQAVTATTERGSGEVVTELEEALRLHRSGWRGPDAFRRIAELTPDPFCARTYRLLASAEERGTDLAGALLSLSEDVRETRRESVKRTATKRRAAMLVPTIAILAPVLILFVAAPLPYLITGWQ
ncbi:MAG TPA: type II secretion system F family protein [Acidimicrobiia bacterium]